MTRNDAKPSEWGPLRRRYEDLLERRRCELLVEREAAADAERAQPKRGKEAAYGD